MQILNEKEYKESMVCLGEIPKFVKSKIEYSSNNNLIYCEEGVTLKNCTISLIGEGNLVYLSKNNHSYMVNLRIYKDSSCFFGEGNYMNGIFNMLVQEHQNILIGDDGVFSYGIFVMTSDAHLIFDTRTHRRINQSKSILIGDHVWVGQYSTILKGSIIGSGSIVGANTLISGKRIPSNTVWGGNPGKQIKRDVFWEKPCPNLYDMEMTERFQEWEKDNSIFGKGENLINWSEFDFKLKSTKDISERLKLIKNLRENKDKDRFYVSEG